MNKFAADSAPLLPLTACFIVGILLAPYAPANRPLWPVLAGVLLLALLVYRWPTVQSVAIGLCLVCLGTTLTSRHRRQFAVDWPSAEVVAEAVIVSEVVEKQRSVAMDLLLVPRGQRLKGYVAKDERSCRLTVGDRLRFKARIRENSHYRKGTFDYRRYLEVHGFTGSVYVPAGQWQQCASSVSGVPLLQRVRLYFLRLRHQLILHYHASGLDDRQLAIVAAMALGDKTGLTPEQQQLYSQTGASHVLALSGLHLSMIYALLSLLVVQRRLRLFTQLLTLLSVWAYVLLVGLPTSVVRAATMITVYGLLGLFHRDRMSVSALAFTALLLLCVNPYTLYDVGFQLSFLAVLSILMWMPYFRPSPRLQRLPGASLWLWLWGLVAVSVAAQLGVAPLVAYYFGRFPTYFLFTNLVAIPATVAILYLSLGSLLLPWLVHLLSGCVDVLNAALTAIVRLPRSSIEGLTPSPLQVLLTYVIVFACYGLVRQLTRWRGQ